MTTKIAAVLEPASWATSRSSCLSVIAESRHNKPHLTHLPKLFFICSGVGTGGALRLLGHSMVPADEEVKKADRPTLSRAHKLIRNCMISLKTLFCCSTIKHHGHSWQNLVRVRLWAATKPPTWTARRGHDPFITLILFPLNLVNSDGGRFRTGPVQVGLFPYLTMDWAPFV